MLVRAGGDVALVIGQASHAWVSGQLARAWGAPAFGEVRPWEEVCLAADQHDVGMATWDLAPALDPETGWPCSFMRMALGTHLDLWSRAPRRLLTQSRYAALLVSGHGTALYERRDLAALAPEEARRVREYLANERLFRDRLLDGLRADPATEEAARPHAVERNQRLLWTWDFISLALCLNWWPCEVERVPAADGEVTVSLRPARAGGGTVTLDPWPFREPRVAVRCEGRRLAGPHGDEAGMRAGLATAPWVTLRFELAALRAPPTR